jgi:translocation and assembly module TamB
MRRVGKWMAWILAAVIGLALLVLALAMGFANTQTGRDWIERTTAQATSDSVHLAGLAGRFPDDLRLARLELRDQQGPWLAIEDVVLDWSLLNLLRADVIVHRLEAGHIALNRLPPPSPEEPSTAKPSLPVSVQLERLHIGRVDLGEAVATRAMSFAIDGHAKLASLQQGEAGLQLKRLDGEGSYTLQASLQDTAINAQLAVQEPAQGLVSSLAGIEELDALSLQVNVEGPLSALDTQLDLAFGPLRAHVQGRLDIEHETISALNLNVTAPAMRPKPDMSWQAIAVDAQVQGRFTQPTARANVRLEGLNAAAAVIGRIALEVQGDAGKVGLQGEVAGLKLPGPQPDLFAAAPLRIQADARLDTVDKPVVFALKHPLLVAEGNASIGAETALKLALKLPDLKPYAAMGGQDVQGSTSLNLDVKQQADITRVELDGILAITGGAPPVPGLLGNAAKLAASVTLRGEDVTVSQFKLDGKILALAVDGALASKAANFKWKLALSDLAAVMVGAAGKLSAQGQIQGPLDKFAATAELDGELATKQLPRGPLNAKVKLDGLPKAPTGEVTAKGQLGGSPLELALAAEAPADGSLHLDIRRADWKSAHAEGGMVLPKGAELPLGKIELRMAHLADLTPLLGQPLAGSVDLSLETQAGNGRPSARLKLDARQAGLVGTATVAQTGLQIAVADPLHKPVVDGELELDGVAAGSLSGGAVDLELAGGLDALKLRLSSRLPNLAGNEFRLDTAASVDAAARQLALAELQAQWKGETLRLLAPARIAFKDGVAVDRLRLGLRQALLEVAVQASPRLDLQASLSGLDLGIVEIFAPDLALAGAVDVQAQLSGTPARPTGTVELLLKELKLRNGPARSLPPVNLTAHAKLNGASAQIDAKAEAGRELALSVDGSAPLSAAGPLDLQAKGAVDLKLLDPVLGASGQRVRGQVSLDATVEGAATAPQIQGSLRLADGDVQDFTNGLRISALNALIEADGGKLRLSKLEGKAGGGTLAASGEVDLLGEGMPVDLSFTARRAKPLAGDRLSVDLNADLSVRGQAKGALAAAGAIHIKQADIRIPEKLPASVTVLKVQRPGEAPPAPPPAASQSSIALNLTIDAPGQIFVRGRGLDAELGGKVQVRGTASNPQPEGGFALRRGDFTLAGQRLIFSKGEVSFNGGSLADPSLDFLAKVSSGSVTAFLNVGGTASKPKISLSSTPELPQDEVLAHLLFGRATTALSTVEMVQIGAAVASLSGVGGGSDPLDSVRKGLGLDRLSVGSSLEAGRYLAPGVYLGAKQGITGAGTQATVQIDIIKGLKVEGAVGSTSTGNTQGGSGSNSVGVIYQYEY